MYRLMQPSDRAAVVALWQKERGDTAEFINTAMDRFAGEQNVYVAEENGQIEAAALAVPGTLQGRPGNYLFGLCGQGSLILAGLVDTLCAQQKLRGAGFTVAVPHPPARSGQRCCRIRGSRKLLPSAACPGKWSATCGARLSLTR